MLCDESRSTQWLAAVSTDLDQESAVGQFCRSRLGLLVWGQRVAKSQEMLLAQRSDLTLLCGLLYPHCRPAMVEPKAGKERWQVPLQALADSTPAALPLPTASHVARLSIKGPDPDPSAASLHQVPPPPGTAHTSRSPWAGPDPSEACTSQTSQDLGSPDLGTQGSMEEMLLRVEKPGCLQLP
ncbi:hypothetical protein P7K49_011990 [Saguinus oedipus]|uniref:Uncharacterized protein n=1 Tax=Saguinus oedipus TaxID=9490 RepID=A0ABQ9VS83_SAGOE|nr:hypothetical protein P7K49_011990 [Saguinus oedipus]